MPKDVMGRQTNVKKAQKAALKINNKMDTAKGAKKAAKSAARNLGFGKGLDKNSEKLRNSRTPANKPERGTAETATWKKIDRVGRNDWGEPNNFGHARENERQKDAVNKRAQDTKLSPRTVSRAIKKGENKANKVTKKVYKSELKKAKVTKAINR